MKYLNISILLSGIALSGCLTSCNDFLDREPLASVSPEYYLVEESQLAAYANQLYSNILPGHSYGYGLFGEDSNTDNQAYFDYNNRFVPGQWKTSQSASSAYVFRSPKQPKLFRNNQI